ncbi:DNA polymerase thumb domain-containing protein [Sporosarcina sp. NPDC096371]|uniref:Y-family DNA polymerase n=1 Tax=Sporosarcina sp. NPDC096371 TaxID=3364530 RepID=UPI0038089269
MMDYSKMPNRPIACIDMMSFYTSCMASLHNLDVQKVPIAIVANLKQQGSVVLAASPPMKKRFNIKTGNRLWEIPHHPEIRLFEPKMSYFIDMSMAITEILHKYVPAEAIHVYSIDESFLDLTGTERLWGDPVQTVKKIQAELLESLNLPSTAGMGPNMLMAKLALDIEGKKTGFAKWSYDDVQTKLWNVSPLSEMWGIGRQTEKSLNAMGIFSVGDLANFDLQQLEKRFGVMGNQLYFHGWGIDLSETDAPLPQGQISYGKNQMLMRDYNTRDEVMVVTLEMCEDVAKRARDASQAGRTISFGISYSNRAYGGGGFLRSRTLRESTNDTMAIYNVCKELFRENHNGDPVRQISISLSKLEDEHSMQLDLFDTKKWQVRKLAAVMDDIQNRFGPTALLRAVSLTDAGTALKRSSLIGGHKG